MSLSILPLCMCTTHMPGVNRIQKGALMAPPANGEFLHCLYLSFFSLLQSITWQEQCKGTKVCVGLWLRGHSPACWGRGLSSRRCPPPGAWLSYSGLLRSPSLEATPCHRGCRTPLPNPSPALPCYYTARPSQPQLLPPLGSSGDLEASSRVRGITSMYRVVASAPQPR